MRQQHSSSSAGFGNPNEDLFCKALHEEGRHLQEERRLSVHFSSFDKEILGILLRRGGRISISSLWDPGLLPLTDKVFSMAEKGQPSHGFLSQTEELPGPGVLSCLWRDGETPHDVQGNLAL